MPPFDLTDVHEVKDEGHDPKKGIYIRPPVVTAIDGGSVSRLFASDELNVSIATGHLNAKKTSVPHMHRKAEEIYYVTSGRGKIHVGDSTFDAMEGVVVYIPRMMGHYTENTGHKPIHLLCLSSPPYTNRDFVRL